MTSNPDQTGYAPVNGLNMYYEVHGTGNPLILLHGGLGLGSMFGDVITQLASKRQVIAADLQAHGHTADIDRPLLLEAMADDIAGLIKHLGFDQADVMGYSMGGNVALRTAIQHPYLVRKLVVMSIPFKRDGWYPEVQAGMSQMGAAAAEYMKNSPIYQAYANAAPKPENFPLLLDKMGDLVRRPYNWSEEVAGLKMPVMLIYGDADSMPTKHIAEFYELVGGSQGDAGWDGSNMPRSQLAILPGTTHYNSFASPYLAPLVATFLDTPIL